MLVRIPPKMSVAGFMEYFIDNYWSELYNEDNIGKVGGEKVGK